MDAGRERDGRNWVEVRKSVAGFTIATAAIALWPGLPGASNLQVLGVFLAVFFVGDLAGTAAFEGRLPRLPRLRWPARKTTLEAEWASLLIVVYMLGLFIGRELFPVEAYRGFLIDEGTMDVPANMARSLIFAGAFGLFVWVLALMVPRSWVPEWLARLRDGPRLDEMAKPPPIDPLDFVLVVLALGSVMTPPMGVMDTLTAPLAWPSPQIAAAFLLLVTLLKRQSIDAARVVYGIVFVVYAILLVRLALSVPTGLDPPGGVVLGVAFAAVLVIDVLAFRFAARPGWPAPTAGHAPV